MSSLSDFFNWSGGVTPSAELPDIFPMPVMQEAFVRTDVVNIYAKILTDVLERTYGLTDDEVKLMWDNCVKSSSSDGLLTMLAKAMASKKELFLVYDSAVEVIRLATGPETTLIRKDYETGADSSVGVYISFKNYDRTDMVTLYSGLEYFTVSALFKSMNLSKAVQFKVSDMRASVANIDAATVIAQAAAVATSLANGLDVMLDANDTIETSTPDLTAVNESINFINQKRCFYLGMPESYISGVQTTGMGSTGEQDTKAVERGLKNYFYSVMKPVLESIFDKPVSYKSQDFRQIAGSMEVLKTFALVDESLLSQESKLKIINQLFDLPEDTKGDEVAPITALPAPVQAPPFNQ